MNREEWDRERPICDERNATFVAKGFGGRIILLSLHFHFSKIQ